MVCHHHIRMYAETHMHSHTTSDWHLLTHKHIAQYIHIRICTNAHTMHTKQTCTWTHTHVYNVFKLVLFYMYKIRSSTHLSASPIVVSNLDNPWMGTISCDVDHVSSRVASASFHPVLFSTASLPPSPLSPGPPSPSGGVLQLHWLQCLHHKWRPAVWLVQCGEQVLQETTVCQQQQFWWSEVGPDNRQVSHSGHCISCEHFRRRDSLPKRDQQHCELEKTWALDCCTVCMYVTMVVTSLIIIIIVVNLANVVLHLYI